MLKPTEKTEREKFRDEYMALCEKYKLQISVFPNWSMNEDKTFSLKIDMSVTELKK